MPVTSNGLGQCKLPALEEGIYVDAAAGGYHTVLLTSRGEATFTSAAPTKAVCGSGQCDIPKLEGTLTYTSVAAGQKVTLLVRSDGCIVYDLPALPPGLSYTRAAAGTFHAALLRSDGCAIHVFDRKQWSEASGDGVPKKYVPNPAFLPISGRICQLDLRPNGDKIRVQLMSVSGDPIRELDVEASCTMRALQAAVDLQNEACQLILPGGRSVQQAPHVTVQDAMVELGHEELSHLDCDQFWRRCVDIPTALVSSVGGGQSRHRGGGGGGGRNRRQNSNYAVEEYQEELNGKTGANTIEVNWQPPKKSEEEEPVAVM
eukprot:s4893_g5.t1